MEIIIPMSGFGERFRRAGYSLPKPLIQIDGKPLIEHIVSMFGEGNSFIFICNQEHLDNPSFRMSETLRRLTDSSRIIGIDPHKLGPVYAVLQAIDAINLTDEVIVNYCDFCCDWDFGDFCEYVRRSGADGVIPAYKGFHPHTLWSNYYAYLKTEENEVVGVQEKTPFTSNPREEFASSGSYYFKTGQLMLDYFQRCIEEELKVNGEYYVSMVYEPMIRDGLNVHVYELNHFMQWGTPEDLEEYQYWSSIFQRLHETPKRFSLAGVLLMPMAGMGSRFADQGYSLPKPLIPVSGRPMALAAIENLPEATELRVVCRSDMPGVEDLRGLLETRIAARVTSLEGVTTGQAVSCMAALDNIDENAPLTIAACDNGLIYSRRDCERALSEENADVVVWVARGYPGAIRSPEMYGWVDMASDGKTIRRVSVKKPLHNPSSDPIIVGAFSFKKASYFKEAAQQMFARKEMVNGEYYVDSAINEAIRLGLRCSIFEVDYYVCWGTPNDLQTYQYWENCFANWPYHPYEGAART